MDTDWASLAWVSQLGGLSRPAWTGGSGPAQRVEVGVDVQRRVRAVLADDTREAARLPGRAHDADSGLKP